MNFIVEKNKVGSRVDKLLMEFIRSKGSNIGINPEALSRTFISEIQPQVTTVNGKSVKRGYKIKENDLLQIDEDALKIAVKKKIDQDDLLSDIKPEPGDLEIIDENDRYVIIKKPHGIAVHPGYKNEASTIANFFRNYLEEKGEYDKSLERGGIVHRLDKGVGGLMLLAKNRESQLYYKSLFENHKVLKMYEAEIEILKETEFSMRIEKELASSGGVSVEEIIKDQVESFSQNKESRFRWIRVGGYIGRDKINRIMMRFVSDRTSSEMKGYKPSTTYIYPLTEKVFLLKIDTGRMHQIRATLRGVGYRVVGDRLYGEGVLGENNFIKLESKVLGFYDQGSVWKSYVI